MAAGLDRLIQKASSSPLSSARMRRTRCVTSQYEGMQRPCSLGKWRLLENKVIAEAPKDGEQNLSGAAPGGVKSRRHTINMLKCQHTSQQNAHSLSSPSHQRALPLRCLLAMALHVERTQLETSRRS